MYSKETPGLWFFPSGLKVLLRNYLFCRLASHQVTNPWSPEHVSQNTCLEVPENAIWTYITSFEQFEDIFHPKAANFWYLAKKKKKKIVLCFRKYSTD